MYLSICKYEASGAGALFSSLSVMSMEMMRAAYENTPQWAEFLENIDANSLAALKRLREWDIKNEIPDNFCEDRDKYLGTERKEQLEKFRKESFERLDENQTSARNGAQLQVKTESAEAKTGDNPDYLALLSIFNSLSSSQERYRLVSISNEYTNDFAMLDIDIKDENNKPAKGRSYFNYGFKIGLSDNHNGWIISAERLTPGQRVIIIKNAKDGKLCCHNFDANQCELVEKRIGFNLESCANFGLRIRPR
jgi:hypothetical protein